MTTCRRRANDMRVRFRVRFHRQMTYVIRTSSTHHPDTCMSCLISWSTTPGVICMSSAHHLQTHMLSASHLHIICTHMSSTHFPEFPNFMQYYAWCHLHIICRHTCHLYVICTSSADTYIICTVLMDPNCISCAKDTSYWCHCGSWCGSWCGPV